MKIVFVVFVVAVAAASTSPVKSKAIDWAKVSEGMEATHEIVFNGATKLKELAVAGDKDIGGEIAAAIDAAAAKGQPLFERILAQVEDQTLTAVVYRDYLEILDTLWEDAIENVRDLIYSLPEEVHKEMTSVYNDAYRAHVITAVSIVRLLSQ